MSKSIIVEELEFLQEAREAFEKNIDWYTYRDKEQKFIALRQNTEIQIYRLDSEVATFGEQLPNHNIKLVDEKEWDEVTNRTHVKKHIERVNIAYRDKGDELEVYVLTGLNAYDEFKHEQLTAGEWHTWKVVGKATIEQINYPSKLKYFN